MNEPEATAALNEALASSAALLGRIETYLQEVGAVGIKTSVIAEEVQVLRAQIDMSAETMGLGLTAEALSHEMFNVADALASRTDSIRRYLERKQITDPELLRYVEHVRSTTRALRKELGHFAPALRFVRDRRETFSMGTFLADQADYYNERWAGKITLVVDVRKDFEVRINRGKLGQVFDNLFLNSEYWLQKAPNASSRSRFGKPKVSVVLNGPYVSVSDNGPGIDPAVEETLFDPFVTRKPRGVGRGLGLYIVRQLLQSEGCSIELAGRRDSGGRMREFVIDFASIIQ